MSRAPEMAWQRPSSSGSVLFDFCHVSRAIATKLKRLGDDKRCYTNQTRSNLVFVKILVHCLHYCSLCGLPKWTYPAISGVVGGPRQSSCSRYSGLLKLNIAADIWILHWGVSVPLRRRTRARAGYPKIQWSEAFFFAKTQFFIFWKTTTQKIFYFSARQPLLRVFYAFLSREIATCKMVANFLPESTEAMGKTLIFNGLLLSEYSSLGIADCRLRTHFTPSATSVKVMCWRGRNPEVWSRLPEE
jgi:hypothetical protein